MRDYRRDVCADHEQAKRDVSEWLAQIEINIGETGGYGSATTCQ